MADVWVAVVTDAELAVAAAMCGYTSPESGSGAGAFFDALAEHVAPAIAAVQAAHVEAESWFLDVEGELVTEVGTFAAWRLCAAVGRRPQGIVLSATFDPTGVTDELTALAAGAALELAGFGSGAVTVTPPS